MVDAIVIGSVALVALVAAAVIAREKVADAAGNFADNPSPTSPAWANLQPRVEDEKQPVDSKQELRGMTRIEAFASIDLLSDFFGEEGNSAGLLAMRNAGLAMFARIVEVPNDGE